MISQSDTLNWLQQCSEYFDRIASRSAEDSELYAMANNARIAREIKTALEADWATPKETPHG